MEQESDPIRPHLRLWPDLSDQLGGLSGLSGRAEGMDSDGPWIPWPIAVVTYGKGIYVFPSFSILDHVRVF